MQPRTIPKSVINEDRLFFFLCFFINYSQFQNKKLIVVSCTSERLAVNKAFSLRSLRGLDDLLFSVIQGAFSLPRYFNRKLKDERKNENERATVRKFCTRIVS